MDYRNAKQEMALLFPNTLTVHESRVDALRFAAEEANGAAFAGVLSRVGRAVTSALRSVIELPRRRAVQNELRMLTDRELADIGLSRGDVAHIYDRDFSAQGQPAATAAGVAGQTFSNRAVSA